MTAEIRDPAFGRVIGENVNVEQLATGFAFTEGPVWHPHRKDLIFSDMPGDHMRRWSAQGGITTFRNPANMANGNTYDRQGLLVTCEHSTSRVTRTETGGSITVLATHYEGKELNSPNDVVAASDGRILFTDPTYGRMPYYGVERTPQLDFRGVYSMAPDGSGLTLIADDFDQPNGLCLSLDEQRLFVNDTERGHIRLFLRKGSGGWMGGEVWVSVTGSGDGAPDGMKIDSAGNLYCCGPGGLHVFLPDAHCIGVIRTPEGLANFTWGEDDYRSLFLTASTSLYRVRTKTPGRPLF